MQKITMQVFWMAFMAMGLAAAMWSMWLLASLSSTHLYSQAIDASVTTATVNQILNSGVQLANANAAAVASVNGGREIPAVNLITVNSNPSLVPQPQAQPQVQPQADTGWSIAGIVWSLIKFAGWLALAGVVVFALKAVL